MLKNIEAKMEGKIMVLRIDTSKNVGETKSGKSVMLATSGGSEEMGNGLYLGLNLYKKK